MTEPRRSTTTSSASVARTSRAYFTSSSAVGSTLRPSSSSSSSGPASGSAPLSVPPQPSPSSSSHANTVTANTASNTRIRPSQLILDLRKSTNSAHADSTLLTGLASKNTSSDPTVHTGFNPAASTRTASASATATTAKNTFLLGSKRHEKPSSTPSLRGGLPLKPAASTTQGSDKSSARWIENVQVKDAASQTTEPFNPNQYASVDWTFITAPHQRPGYRDHDEDSDSDEERDLSRGLGGLRMKMESVSTHHLQQALTPLSNTSLGPAWRASSPLRSKAPDADQLLLNPFYLGEKTHADDEDSLMHIYGQLEAQEACNWAPTLLGLTRPTPLRATTIPNPTTTFTPAHPVAKPGRTGSYPGSDVSAASSSFYLYHRHGVATAGTVAPATPMSTGGTAAPMRGYVPPSRSSATGSTGEEDENSSIASSFQTLPSSLGSPESVCRKVGSGGDSVGELGTSGFGSGGAGASVGAGSGLVAGKAFLVSAMGGAFVRGKKVV
ncbi:hypothetical protein BC830DRAFT_1138707, partial [Chytriomyces sp. MP71]